MKILLKIIDQDCTEQINIETTNRNSFSYVDSYGADNKLDILEDGIQIHRKEIGHKTEVFLTLKKSFINIITDEGNLYFDAKVIAFNKNNDIISLVYSINNENKKIEIHYLEV